MPEKTTTERRIQFENLVKEAELAFQENPKGYKRKLVLLVYQGYAYIFCILFFTLLLITGCVIGLLKSRLFFLIVIKQKLGIFLIGLIYVLIRAMWVKIDAPQGYILTAKIFPTLHNAVDEISQKLKTPKIHQIILIPDFNACMLQTPRLGIFGMQKNTLMLGLQLLLSMSRRQTLSVIAHELGHLSGNHSKFAGWIYRISLTWMRINDAFVASGIWSSIIFGKFLNWYAPYFNAYSFALRRANEFEADSFAAEMISGNDMAQALIQSKILDNLNHKHYWKNIQKMADTTPTTHKSVYSNLLKWLKETPYTLEEMQTVLNDCLNVKTGYSDTHPSLKDRVSPYLQEIKPVALPPVSAAEDLLGRELDGVLRDFDRYWVEDYEDTWQYQYEYTQASKKKLESLVQKNKGMVLKDDDLWSLAVLTEQFKPDVDPLPLYLEYWQQNKNDMDANYAVGRLLLARNDKNGLVYLDRSMQNRVAIIPACELAYCYLKESGDLVAAEEVRRVAERQFDLEEKARVERTTFSTNDTFMPHNLSKLQIRNISKQLQNMKQIKQAWICRKEMKTFPDDVVHILIYQTGWGDQEKQTDKMLIETLKMPTDYFVFKKNGEYKKLTKKALTHAIQIL